MRFRLCSRTSKGRTVHVDKRSVTKIEKKVQLFGEDLRYNHSYYFGRSNPCEFLRNDGIDFCESAPDGSN